MPEISASTDDTLAQGGLTPDQIARIRAAPSTSLVTGLPPQTGGLPLTAFDDGYAAISGSPRIAGLSFSPPGTPLSPYSPAAQGVTSAKPGPDPRSPAGQGWTPPQAGSGPTTAPNIPPSGAGSAGAATSDGLLLTPNLATTGRWPVDWSDESLPFKERYDDMLRHMPANLRPGVQVEDAYRTEEQQRQLYDDPTAGGPGHVVARPGPNAPHVKGIAADLKFVGPMGSAAEQWVRANAPKYYGLDFPLANDPNHMQLAENVDQTKWDVPLLQKTAYELESSSGKNIQQPSGPDSGVGPMQITPATFREYARPGEDINNPQNNIDVGNRILTEYYKRYGGDMNKALLAYRMGKEWMDANLNTPVSQMPQKAQDYLDKAHRMWGGNIPGAPLGAPYAQGGVPGAAAYGPYFAQREADRAAELDAIRKLQEGLNNLTKGSPEYDEALHNLLDRQMRMLDREEQHIMHPPVEKRADMFANFGSLATIIGIFGGLRSRAPLTASLNAAGSAMEAINTNNHELWKESFDTWKEQGTLMNNALQHESQIYRDILADKRLSWDEKMAQLNVQFQINQNLIGIRAAATGDLKAMIELPSTQQQIADDHQKALDQHAKTEAEAEKIRGEAGLQTNMGPWLKATDAKDRSAFTILASQTGNDPVALKKAVNDPTQVENARKQAEKDLTKEAGGGSEQEKQTQNIIAQEAADAGMSVEDFKKQKDYPKIENAARIRAAQELGEGKPPSAAQLADEKQASEVWTVLNLGDQTIGMIESAQMTVGLSGRLVGRPAEIVGNILGASDETTRAQIQSNISNLRLQMVPLLTGIHRATGRELDLSTAIVRGLEPGSTVQNTVRSIEEAQDAIRSQYYPQLVRHGFLSPDPNRPAVLGAPAANPAQPAPVSPRSSTVESLPDPKTVAEHTRSRNMETGEIQEVIGGKWVTVH